MDWFTKYVTLLPCAFGPDHLLGAGGAADLLVRYIVCKCSVPWSIVYEKDEQFTVDLWRSIWKFLGTRSLLSTAYNP